MAAQCPRPVAVRLISMTLPPKASARWRSSRRQKRICPRVALVRPWISARRAPWTKQDFMVHSARRACTRTRHPNPVSANCMNSRRKSRASSATRLPMTSSVCSSPAPTRSAIIARRTLPLITGAPVTSVPGATTTRLSPARSRTTTSERMGCIGIPRTSAMVGLTLRVRARTVRPSCSGRRLIALPRPLITRTPNWNCSKTQIVLASGLPAPMSMR